MRIPFLLVYILFYFFNPLFIKSEENIRSSNIKTNNTSQQELLDDKKSNIRKIHIVRTGDTISSISKTYSVDKNLIIKLNNLKNENYIFVGQNLVISDANRNLIEQKSFENQENNFTHTVQAGENLTDIANNYNLEISQLININNLKNPDSIKVGEKILLRKENSLNSQTKLSNQINNTNELTFIDRKVYGPLTIKSNQLNKLNKRQILEVTNQNNKKLFLSIGCKKKELDVRIPGRKWRGWKPVKEDFEKNLINDFC